MRKNCLPHVEMCRFRYSAARCSFTRNSNVFTKKKKHFSTIQSRYPHRGVHRIVRLPSSFLPSASSCNIALVCISQREHILCKSRFSLASRADKISSRFRSLVHVRTRGDIFYVTHARCFSRHNIIHYKYRFNILSLRRCEELISR